MREMEVQEEMRRETHTIGDPDTMYLCIGGVGGDVESAR